MSYKFITERSESGDLTLLAISGGRRYYLHSRHNPLKEAENIISRFNLSKYDFIILLGLGLGYVLNKLRQIGGKKIFVVEKDEEIFKIFEKNNKIGDEIFFINKDVQEVVNNLISFFNIKDNKGLLIIDVYGVTRLYPEYYEEFKRVLNLELNKAINFQLTVSKLFIPTYRNFLKNIKNLNRFKIIKFNKETLKGSSALIISAGPSIEREIDKIKEIRDKVYIFAVDSVVKFLIKEGVVPDFIFSIDPQYYTKGHFENLKIPDNVILFFDIFSNYILVEKFKNICLVISRNFISENLFFDFEYLMDSNSGSVTNYIYQFVKKVGFGKIILSGLDLSYEEDRIYVRENYIKDFYLKRVNKFNTILNFYQSVYRKLGVVEIKFKSSLYKSSRAMVGYYEWLKNNIDKAKTFISSFSRVEIEGVERLDILELSNSKKELIYELEKVREEYFKERLGNFERDEKLKKMILDLINFCRK